MAHDVSGKDGDVVDRLQVVEREVEGAAGPGDQVVHGALDLLLDRGVHRLGRQRADGDQDLPQRAPRRLALLLPQGLVERVLGDAPVVHQQVAEPLGIRPPGVDDPPLVEPDLRAHLAAGQGERAGASAQMDELEGVRDRDVLEVAGEAHGGGPSARQPRLTSWIRLSSVFSLRSVWWYTRAANRAEAAWAASRSSSSRSSGRSIALCSKSLRITSEPTTAPWTVRGTTATASEPSMGPMRSTPSVSVASTAGSPPAYLPAE